jgi:hypothetical protein
VDVAISMPSRIANMSFAGDKKTHEDRLLSNRQVRYGRRPNSEKTTKFGPRDNSRKPIRLTARIQRAEMSSVFLEWCSVQIIATGCFVKPRSVDFTYLGMRFLSVGIEYRVLLLKVSVAPSSLSSRFSEAEAHPLVHVPKSLPPHMRPQ